MSCSDINASTKHLNEWDNKAQNKLALAVAVDKHNNNYNNNNNSGQHAH